MVDLDVGRWVNSVRVGGVETESGVEDWVGGLEVGEGVLEKWEVGFFGEE